MLKRALIFFLISGITPCLAQQSPSKENLPSDELARQRAWSVLYELPDQLKLMDEPTLRVFLRLRLADFLWQHKNKNDEAKTRADALALDTLEDIKAHKNEIPELYYDSFRRDLQALIQLNAPTLAARLVELNGSEPKKGNTFEVAFSMLDSKDGASSAVKLVKSGLDSGQDPGNLLIFFLSRLEKEHPDHLTQLLREIMSIEERRTGTIPIRSLLQIIRFYLNDQSPKELMIRYVSVVVKSLEMNFESSDEHLVAIAHSAMSNVILSRIEQLAPSLYTQARSLTVRLAGRMPRTAIDLIDTRARINQSSDPLNQMIIEANASKDESIKENLLAEAAQIALSKNQLKQALDLVPATSVDPNFALWRNQFLEDISARALEKKDPDLALSASSRIDSPLNRAHALLKIGLYFHKWGDRSRALDSLHEAEKLVERAENGSDKVNASLSLAEAFLKIDPVRVPDTVQAAIKIVNLIHQPGLEHKPDSQIRKSYARSLADIAWNMQPVFQSIVRKDEIGTFGLANGIQLRDLRAIAIFGAATGILLSSGNVDSRMK